MNGMCAKPEATGIYPNYNHRFPGTKHTSSYGLFTR